MRIEEGPLRTYLQGHAAGSVAGEGIATRLRDTTEDAATKDFLSGFIEDVREERRILEELLEQVDDAGLMRRGLDVAADVAAKAGRLAEPASPGSFADLEALAVGVWGKRLLWGTLRSLAEVDDTFRSIPVDELSDRAERQEIELLRLRQDAIIPTLASRRVEPG
jgi:hypothetical protein